MENFSEELKNHAAKIINYEKKTNEENQSSRIQKFVIYAKKNLVLMITIKNTIKFEIIVITQENIEVLLIIFLI